MSLGGEGGGEEGEGGGGGGQHCQGSGEMEGWAQSQSKICH